MSPSPKFANEIQRLMRDPDALRAEREPRPSGRGPYDPNQPRVPAGNPKGGSSRRRDIKAEISGAMRA